MGRLNHDQRRLIPPASSRNPICLWPGRLASLPAGDDEAFAPRSVPLTADARQEFAHVPGRTFSLFTPAEHQLATRCAVALGHQKGGYVLRVTGMT